VYTTNYLLTHNKPLYNVAIDTYLNFEQITRCSAATKTYFYFQPITVYLFPFQPITVLQDLQDFVLPNQDTALLFERFVSNQGYAELSNLNVSTFITYTLFISTALTHTVISNTLKPKVIASSNIAVRL